MAAPSSGAAAAAAATMAAVIKKPPFQPRLVYEASPSITRSYFLGHHQAAVSRMRRVLSNIGLVIECRDLRVPLSSWNSILERELAAVPGRARLIVYTKKDLCRVGNSPRSGGGKGGIQAKLIAFHNAEQRNRHLGGDGEESSCEPERNQPPAALFIGEGDDQKTNRQLLAAIKDIARRHDRLVGLRALVVGMPNAGKSQLLNRLRKIGVGGGKVAKTGAQPGVTRKLGTPVRIAWGDDTENGVPGEGIFVMDTPGVFVPHVADPETMLKLALVGCVKDGLVQSIVVADYLLFHLNLHCPKLYTEMYDMEEPTNDVNEFLEAVARRTGKLGKGGVPNPEAAAELVIRKYRVGELGQFLLDEVSEESLKRAKHDLENPVLSLNQARIREKERRKEAAMANRHGSKS